MLQQVISTSPCILVETAYRVRFRVILIRHQFKLEGPGFGSLSTFTARVYRVRTLGAASPNQFRALGPVGGLASMVMPVSKNGKISCWGSWAQT